MPDPVESELPVRTVESTRIRPQVARTARVQQQPEPPAEAPVPGEELVFPIDVTQQPRAGVSLKSQGQQQAIRADMLVLDTDVTNNRFFQADTFRLTLAYVEEDENFGRAFWDEATRIDVEIFAGFGVDEPPSEMLLAGRVDEIQLDLDGRTVSLSGRDYTADLIEYRLAEKYPNRRASEIAEILAGAVGLEAEVTTTEELAGVYYRAEHVQMADETTAWNLLTYLAEHEGFDCYVMGKKLFFGPPPDPITAKSWTLAYVPSDDRVSFPQALASRLELTKALTVSREIVVKVISWNSSQKRALTGTSRSARPARSSSGQFTSPVAFVVREANLTQDQADRRARQLAEDITQKLRTFDADLPGDPRIDIRTIVNMVGTKTSFDTKYFIDELQRRISNSAGFTMRIRGRNVAPDDTAAL